MRITALVENTTARQDVGAEHGLSLYIETAEKRILFDMGQSDLFLSNAAAMGIDAANVDVVVLSHGHYDHGGGLNAFLRVNDHAPVYVSRYAFEEHRNKAGKNIGLSPTLMQCERLIFTDEMHPVADGISLHTCNQRKRVAPIQSDGMTAEGVEETFRHEQYLLIEEDGKKVLISGCSHKGVENIAEWFKPDVLVGGFHLSHLLCNEDLTALAKRLGVHNTAYYTCHCTGVEQYQWMRSTLPHLGYLAAGEWIEI